MPDPWQLDDETADVPLCVPCLVLLALLIAAAIATGVYLG